MAVAGRAAQREDTGQEGNLAHGQAIHEILAATIDRIANLDRVLAVLGRFVEQHRVGMEEIMVGIGQFMAPGVVERQGGLKPAGHGVGDIRNQFLRGGGDDQALTLAGLEAIAVHLAGHDLAVDHRRQRDLDRRGGGRGPWLVAVSRRLGGLRVGQGRDFRHDLGKLADLEGQRVGESPLRLEADFPTARLGVGRHDNLQHDRFGRGRNGRPAQGLGQLLARGGHEHFVFRGPFGPGGRFGFSLRAGRGGVVGRGGLLFLQLLEFLLQVARLAGPDGLEVVDHLGLHAAAGNRGRGGAVEILAADEHHQRRTLPAAGGKDVTGMRRLLLLGRYTGDTSPECGSNKDRGKLMIRHGGLCGCEPISH